MTGCCAAKPLYSSSYVVRDFHVRKLKVQTLFLLETLRRWFLTLPLNEEQLQLFKNKPFSS